MNSTLLLAFLHIKLFLNYLSKNPACDLRIFRIILKGIRLDFLRICQIQAGFCLKCTRLMVLHLPLGCKIGPMKTRRHFIVVLEFQLSDGRVWVLLS